MRWLLRQARWWPALTARTGVICRDTRMRLEMQAYGRLAADFSGWYVLCATPPWGSQGGVVAGYDDCTRLPVSTTGGLLNLGLGFQGLDQFFNAL